MSQNLKTLLSERPIVLNQKIASSGEGTVWTTDLPGFLAKLYHQPTADRIDKLKVMVAHPPKNPMRHHHHVTFAWPQDLLVDAQGNGLGFLMPEIVDGVKLSLIYNPKLRSRKAPRFNWYYLHTAALNFALALKSLHEEGYIVGDVKPQNLLVNSRALISVIDADSFQVRDPLTKTLYRCLVGSEGFTPVELLGKELATIDQEEVHDRFRLGVMIYLLLFGDQPFKGKWIGRGESPQPSELIRQGAWPYAPNSQVQPGPNTIPLSILHPQLQVCFQRCFTAGHQNPQERPSAQDWGDALKLAITDLRMCHLENNHHYSRTYGRCYWCDRRASLGVDIFSPVPAIQRTAAPQPRKGSAPPARQPAGSRRKTTPIKTAPSAVSTMANGSAHSFSGMAPLQAATHLLQSSRTAVHRRTSLLHSLHHPAVWGGGCIAIGILGLGMLLLPELQSGLLIQQGASSLESVLQQKVRPFFFKAVPLQTSNADANASLAAPAEASGTSSTPLAAPSSTSFASTPLMHGGHWDTVTTLDLTLDDRLLVSGSKDTTVKLWSFPDGKLKHTFSDHYEPLVTANFSKVAKTLVTSSLGGKVMAWDLKTLTLASSLPLENNFGMEGTIRNAATDDSNSFVASSGWGGAILLQYLQSGKTIRIPSNAMTSEQALVVVPNGRQLVTSTSDGLFQVWDATTGSLLRTFPDGLKSTDLAEPISALTISRDGKLLASGGWYGSVALWNLETGTLIRRFPKQDKPVSVLAINHQNNLLASVSSNATIQLWDITTGARHLTLRDAAATIFSLKFSRYGDLLVSGSDEPAIKVWNLKTRKLLKTLVQ